MHAGCLDVSLPTSTLLPVIQHTLPSCALFAGRQVAEDLGFSMETGRLDVSVHPFTSGFHPTDVRITSRYKEDNLTEGLTGTVHETGVWMFAG